MKTTVKCFVGKEKLGDNNIMVRKQVPLRLCLYAFKYYCDLSTMIVPGMSINKVSTGYEIIFRDTPDIRAYMELEFYK